jgi:hypothetical protein
MSGSRAKKKKGKKPIHLMGLEEAEHRALGNLIMTTDEASRLSTRLRDEYGREPVEIQLWATVRHLEPRARWEQSFADEATLNKFRASFKRNSYRVQDIPRRLPLPDFLANMRANEHRQDLKQFGRLVKYLEDSKLSWYLTVQTVHAERDPRQLDPGSFWTALGAAFGKRIAYRLEEYCLVVDLILTNVDRRLTTAVAASEERNEDARLVALLLKEANVTAAATIDASENDANEEDSSSSSSSSSGPNSLGVSSSSSSGSSRRPLPTASALESVVNAAASTAAAQTLGATLLRSTSYSGSSSSTTAKPRQAFIPVLKSKGATPLSRSASSSSMSTVTEKKKE